MPPPMGKSLSDAICPCIMPPLSLPLTDRFAFIMAARSSIACAHVGGVEAKAGTRPPRVSNPEAQRSAGVRPSECFAFAGTTSRAPEQPADAPVPGTRWSASARATCRVCAVPSISSRVGCRGKHVPCSARDTSGRAPGHPRRSTSSGPPFSRAAPFCRCQSVLGCCPW